MMNLAVDRSAVSGLRFVVNSTEKKNEKEMCSLEAKEREKREISRKKTTSH